MHHIVSIFFSLTAKGKQLGFWEDFGPCEGIGENNSCGKGKQKRRRKCIDGDNDKCSSADTEMTVSCNLPDCSKQLGNWENIGACMTNGEPKTCGSGNQQQTRSCVDGTVDKCSISDKESTKLAPNPTCPRTQSPFWVYILRPAAAGAAAQLCCVFFLQ